MGKLIVVIPISLGLFLVACTKHDSVFLKNPTTGEIVECASGSAFSVGEKDQKLAELRYCVDDFKDQGYVRVQ